MTMSRISVPIIFFQAIWTFFANVPRIRVPRLNALRCCYRKFNGASRVQGFALCALRRALCALRPASRDSLRFSFNIIKSIDLEKIELIIANYRKSVRIYCCWYGSIHIKSFVSMSQIRMIRNKSQSFDTSRHLRIILNLFEIIMRICTTMSKYRVFQLVVLSMILIRFEIRDKMGVWIISQYLLFSLNIFCFYQHESFRNRFDSSAIKKKQTI